MKEPIIKLKTLSHAEGLESPQYMSEGASGMDLRAACPQDQPVELLPGERVLVPTGLCMSIPIGYEAQIRPRSGLAIKSGITCLNTPGTIDADYRGEIQIILINLSSESFLVERGMRIAQMVIQEVKQATLVIEQELDTTMRGSGGFGHTGV